MGFENNMQLVNGAIAPDNSALITQVATEIGCFQRSIATGSEARALVGL